MPEGTFFVACVIRSWSGEGPVAYVKTESGYEVDFHARMADGTESLVQVSVDVDASSTLEREVRALSEAATYSPMPHCTS